MPRRREVTLEGLGFAWGADGAPSGARMAERPRPMAYELGRVVLTLEAAASAAQEQAARPRMPHVSHAAHVVRGAEAPAPSTAEVSQLAAVAETEARAALRELLLTGCVVRQRVKLGRQRDFARWAHGFQLAPTRDERGPGRRARLTPLALVIEPSLPCGDLLDVLLRRAGVLPVQVVSAQEARRLLGRLGFELVVVESEAAQPVGMGPLVEAVHAAGCGAILWLTPPGAASAPRAFWRHPAVTLPRPFSPDAFAGALAGLGTGTFDPLAHPHEIDPEIDPQEIEEIGV